MSRARFTASDHHRMSQHEKRQYARLVAPPTLWRCRLCGVKVLGRDQAGHTARAHGGVGHGWDMVMS